MSFKKSVIISKESKINRIINKIKLFLFGERVRKKGVQNSIEKLKEENERLKGYDEEDNLLQTSIQTNEKKIAMLSYMNTLKNNKRENKKEIIIVE